MPKPAPLTGPAIGNTLVDQLIPVVADIRQLGTVFGIRPYRVFIVRGAWSGATRGQGDFTVVNNTELLPTPKVEGMQNIDRRADQGGLHEMGGVKVSEIVPKHGSTGYSEDDLLGQIQSRPLAINEEVYVVVQEDGGVTKNPVARKFRVRGAPELHTGNVEWILKLDRVER